MNWQSELRSWALASAGAFCLGAIGYRVMTAPKLPDLNPTVAHIDAATGAWANASAQQVQSVAAIERDVRAELWHVDRLLITAQGTLQAGSGALDTLSGQLSHVAPLLDSLRAASDSIPPAVAGVAPVLANADGAVTDVRRFITQPALTDTLGSAASLTASAAAITSDARKVADKTTADYLKPVPWYMWPIKRGSEILDIGAAVARHTP